MPTLLDTVRGLVTPQLVSRLASSSGETGATVTTGLTAAVPTLLVAIADQSDDRSFITRLMALVTDPGAETALSSTSAAGTAPADDSSLTGRLLALVTGGNPSRMADTLGRTTGLSASTVGPLLGVAGSLVLGSLSKLARTERLDGAALASRLRSERSGIAAALPSIPAVEVAPPVGPARIEPAPRRRETSSPWRWAIPVLLGALALWGISAMLGRRGDDRAARTVTGTEGAVATTGGEMLSHTLPSGASLRFPRGATEDRLLRELQESSGAETPWIDFDRIGFATGSAALTPASQAQLRNVATILQAYPAIRIKIGGYTDNIGDPAANLQLSKERAAAVRNALEASGVSETRLEAEGYGPQYPIANNATEDGREKNRRVALRIESR